MFSPNLFISTSNNPGANGVYDAMHTIGRHVSVKKGRAVVKEGSHDRCFFYVKEGIFKTVKDVRDKSYILGFTFADGIACCPSSLLNGLPNNFTIEAVSDAEILVCHWKDFEVYANTETYNNLVKYLLIYNLAFVEGRLVDAISLNAEQGYRRLLLQEPEKLQHIPLSYVASYLGISIERLSRIRRKIKIDLGHIVM